MSDAELSNKERTGKKRFVDSFLEALPKSFAIAFSVGVIFLLASVVFMVYTVNMQKIDEIIKQTPVPEILVYIFTWLILGFISYVAYYQIKEIINEKKTTAEALRKRANYIAVIIGSVLTIILLKQPFLDQLFSGHDTETWIRILLIGGGVGGGWVVWYLKQMETYGEFFHVLLLTVVTGFCLYARLSAPEEIQHTAVAFLLGSLFRVGTDYLKQAFSKTDKQN